MSNWAATSTTPIAAGVTYRGIPRVLGSIEGVRRFGALFQPVSWAQLLPGPSPKCTSPQQVYDAIREFGSQKRIFWVHFRNIRGGLGAFDEVFPDEGSIDMRRAYETYKEVGYDGVLVPDHMPHIIGDTPQCHRARAFCFGYIRGLLGPAD